MRQNMVLMTINTSSSGSVPALRELQSVIGRQASKAADIKKETGTENGFISTQTGPAANAAATGTTGSRLNETA